MISKYEDGRPQLFQFFSRQELYREDAGTKVIYSHNDLHKIENT